MASRATMENVLAGAPFPANRDALLTHATKGRASGAQLAALSALPDRAYTDGRDVTAEIGGSPTHGRISGTLSALLAAGAGAAAVRTLVRQVATRSLGPVGVAITAVQTAVAVRAGMRAVARWRSDRRLRSALGAHMP